MVTQSQTIWTQEPVQALLNAAGGGVLALIAGVEGPSYRPVGAMMAIIGEQRVGTLSSGCIEADIALHARTTLTDGRPRMIRYGCGSPFMDIELPCGGGLDILLVPHPDRMALEQVAANWAQRIPCTLLIDTSSGRCRVADKGDTALVDGVLRIRLQPEIRFLIFGKGPEACTFARLVQSAGYPNLLLSPDPETLTDGELAGCGTQHLSARAFPPELAVDDRTAITLFFHDHDWEPVLLAGALDTPAFYIGAQGSQRARDARLLALAAMGVAQAALARLHGPIGLIPSARDPGTLSVSVLAEILATAMRPAG
ncbi:XdhC family protein [Paracoccus sp. (in: a-proteobacteria)]|uniref:XdhC family protein n=1 Tax=Paracoccus sp. TaxID=267 RepID=UPI003A88130B